MRWTGVWAAALCLAAGARGEDPQLTKVLAQLDAAAAKFTSAQAEFSWDQYTKVVDEHDVQKGTIYFRRGGKAGTAMAAHIATENDVPAEKDVLYKTVEKGSELDLYQPGIKQETVLHPGANSSQFESFATLGFGGSGKDLQVNWNVSYEGADTAPGGKQIVKLGLVPKNPGKDPLFTKIDIWVDPETATSLKQVFTMPTGDNRTATYTAIMLNHAPEKAFTLTVPKGTEIVSR